MPAEISAPVSRLGVTGNDAAIAQTGPAMVVNPDGTPYDPEEAAGEAIDAPEDDPALAEEADPLDQPEPSEEMPDAGAAERDGTVAPGTAVE